MRGGSPQALEDRGGWPEREIVHALTEYVEHVVARLGDRVSHWICNRLPLATGQRCDRAVDAADRGNAQVSQLSCGAPDRIAFERVIACEYMTFIEVMEQADVQLYT